MTFQKALAFVKQKRPIVQPNLGFQKQLLDFETQLKVTLFPSDLPLYRMEL